MNTQRNRGFSLLELAIVLLVVGLLMTSTLSLISSQRKIQLVKDTQNQLEIIKTALIGFAIQNGRLPCPADPTIATGSTGAGEEDWDSVNLVCFDDNGVVPWVDLGLPETDAWGRRFTYKVRDIFADDISKGTVGGGVGCTDTPVLASFALCSQGSFDIWQDSTLSSYVVKDVPVVIVSHGENGYGAYLPSGQQMSISSNSPDEVENSDVSTDGQFIDHAQDNNYDDIITWLSTYVLLNKMVTVGKLP